MLEKALAIIWAILLAALIVLAFFLNSERSRLQRELTHEKEGRAADQIAAEKKARLDVIDARNEEREIARKQRINSDAQARDLEIARDAATRLAAANDGLQSRATALRAAANRARTCPGAPAERASEADRTPADLLDDMQRRVTEAAIGIASYADKLKASNTRCAADYDALEMRARETVDH